MGDRGAAGRVAAGARAPHLSPRASTFERKRGSVALNTLTLLGALAGLALGALFLWAGEGSAVATQGLYLCGLVSGVFIDLLKMILVPLVFTSIVVGVANLRAHQQIHKVWMATIGYVFTTTSIAIFLGLMAAHIFQPGTELRIESFAAAMADGNVLAIVVFALIAGVALLGSLARFIAVVIGTTLFHGIVILPLILYLIARVSPLRFFVGVRPALVTAFATSSSSATIPVTLEYLEKHLKVTPDVARFVVPIGAQVNMDGTALYEAAAALFVANLVGMDLTVGQQLVICFTTMLASIGAPGIPSAGMVTMIMVLQSVGLPAEAVAILLPIDRPLDTVRTMVNVEGDMVGSLVIDKLTASTPAARG